MKKCQSLITLLVTYTLHLACRSCFDFSDKASEVVDQQSCTQHHDIQGDGIISGSQMQQNLAKLKKAVYVKTIDIQAPFHSKRRYSPNNTVLYKKYTLWDILLSETCTLVPHIFLKTN